MGLPSGTLWLDRPLGAKNVGDPGNWYQWGALVGYSDVMQYDFTLANYQEQGLNLITSDLTKEQDAATMYYGGAARIPTRNQIEELFNNVTISISDSTYILRSNINGNVIKIRATGEVDGQTISHQREVFIWSRRYNNATYAYGVHLYTDGQPYYQAITRYFGLLILPVKSS